VGQISISHDGSKLAFVTSSVSERQEKPEDIELYLVNLNGGATAATPVRLTHNEAVNSISSGLWIIVIYSFRSTWDRWSGNMKIRSRVFTGSTPAMRRTREKSSAGLPATRARSYAIRRCPTARCCAPAIPGLSGSLYRKRIRKPPS